jgi:outer membrane protein TolC
MKYLLKKVNQYLFLMLLPLAVQAQSLSLVDALRLAEQTSPELKAAQARQKEAGETSAIAESSYFPTLDLAAVDSGGFPGSSSGLDGFSGLMTSPYRSGPAAGAFSKWDLVDFSVWHDVSAAHFAQDASREAVRFQRASIGAKTLGVYLSGVRYRGEFEAWQKMVTELTSIQETVDRFVRNGQYSEVEKILIEDQLENAGLQISELQQKYQATLVRLGLLTGLDPQKITCPLPVELSEENLSALTGEETSPLISRAEFEQKSANETVGKYSAQNLPKLEVAASAGYLSDTRLVNSQDYSVFVGITMPIFEGFRIDAQEKRARDEAEAKAQELASAKLTLADLNAEYDQQIDTAREDLKTLVPEQISAQRGVVVAKQRYLSFLSPLANLQQALKDMVAVDTQIAEVKTSLLLAMGSKALLNGKSLSPEVQP